MIVPSPKGKEKAAIENNFLESLKVSEESYLSGKGNIS